MQTFTLIFITALFLSSSIELWLAQRHLRYVHTHRGKVPKLFTDVVTLDQHYLAADYTTSKTKLARVTLFISIGLLLYWTLGGGLQLLDSIWRDLQLGPVLTGVCFLMSLFFISSLLDIPQSLYSTFVLEQRFGFNKTTPKLFINDLIKENILSLALGIPLSALFIWLMINSGSMWWLYAWSVWMSFSLLMLWAFPSFIAPMFNKFTPLEDGELKERIVALLTRCGFASNGIFIMDGSKRTAHGNAYFTGLGKNKRIVFYDTLINELTIDEIEAVLAHELGHFKHKHIVKRIFSMAAMTLLGLALLGWLMEQKWFYTGLGVEAPSVYMALALFMLTMPVFSTFFHPISSFISRKHEFEADDYASQQANAQHLINALIKLYKENASTLTPDPLYSAFHDSHPPASVRVANLSSKLESK